MSDEWHEFTPDLDFFVDELRYIDDQLEANRAEILESGTDDLKERYRNLVYILRESIHSIADEEPGPKTRILILRLVHSQLDVLGKRIVHLQKTRTTDNRNLQKWQQAILEIPEWQKMKPKDIISQLEANGLYLPARTHIYKFLRDRKNL